MCIRDRVISVQLFTGPKQPEETWTKIVELRPAHNASAVHDVGTVDEWPPTQYESLWTNAHFRRDKADIGLVVVEGDPARSRLLEKAHLLSDGRQNLLPEMQRRLGLEGSIKRAGAGRWVASPHVAETAEWLLGLQ